MPSVSQPTPQAQQPNVAVLDGVLERVTFSNPETGYTIARIAPDRGTGRGPVSADTELITAVGPLLGAQVGESLRLRGRWTSHLKYGRQFEVHSYTTVLPATEQGIRRYLGSGLIKGIGPVMAERMVSHFGIDIMHIIDDEPDRLVEVPGLGPKRSARIKDAWAEQKAIKEVMIFLQGVGVSTSLAVKIYKKYGDESIDTVKQQPYRLAADIWGIGFKTADTIAASVGIATRQPRADQGRPRLHPVRGRRRRPLLPPGARPGRRRHEDPRRPREPHHAPDPRSRRRGTRRPRRGPGPRCRGRRPAAGRLPAALLSFRTVPGCLPSADCSPPARTAWQRSRRWTGRRPSAG